MRTFEQALKELKITSASDQLLIERAALIGYLEFGRGAVRYEQNCQHTTITYIFQNGYLEWLKEYFLHPEGFQKLMQMMATYDPHQEYVIFAQCYWDHGQGHLLPEIMPITIFN